MRETIKKARRSGLYLNLIGLYLSKVTGFAQVRSK